MNDPDPDPEQNRRQLLKTVEFNHPSRFYQEVGSQSKEA